MCCIQLVGSPATNIPRVSLPPQVCHCSQFQSTPLPLHWTWWGSTSAPVQVEQQRFYGSSATGIAALSPPCHMHTTSLLFHSVALVCTSVTKNNSPKSRELSPTTSPLAFTLRHSSPACTCPCCQNCCKGSDRKGMDLAHFCKKQESEIEHLQTEKLLIKAPQGNSAPSKIFRQVTSPWCTSFHDGSQLPPRAILHSFLQHYVNTGWYYFYFEEETSIFFLNTERENDQNRRYSTITKRWQIVTVLVPAWNLLEWTKL